MANLLLVDFENVHRVDTSRLDNSFEVIIFVGAMQKTPALPQESGPAKQRLKVSFQKVSGNGRNALDFHVAFHLGRVFETARDTHCFVLSRDTGFDPLLNHLKCQRIEVQACGRACRHRPNLRSLSAMRENDIGRAQRWPLVRKLRSLYC